ncbi:MAG: alpha-2-macroglobulin family protein [Gemmataceae bacterium]
MSARDPLDELALDYLYGLLDAADAEAARARLDSPEGRIALDRAGRMQQLLSVAAKSDFPGVRFEPPVEPVRSSMPVRRWLGWAVVAAALMAVSAPPAANFVRSERLRHELADSEAALQSVHRDLANLTAERATRLQSAGQAVAQARHTLEVKEQTLVQQVAKAQEDQRARQLSLVISGPASLTPGASNDYRVQTLNGVGVPTTAQLAARIRDQAGAIVFEEKLEKASATWDLKLPPDLPLTPNRELFLELEAKGEVGPPSELRERLQLATPMFITHLATDKPMYQPGETVRFRSLTLDRLRLRPPSEDFTLSFVVRDPRNVETAIVTGRALLTGPDGRPVTGPDGKAIAGVGAGEWVIPESASGGEWTLVVREQSSRFPEQKRTFLVNKYQPPRLNKVLEWSKKSYGPGETVVANVKVERAEGGPVTGKPVTAEVRVDDATFRIGQNLTTDAEGRVAIRYALPEKIERGVASLNLGITDGGTVEPLSKPIPIVLKKFLVDFYPEGGDLVAGVPNRVYFQVRSTLGKPADVTGRIVDAAGQTVATAATLTDDKEAGINQGQGRTEFTPEFGQTYKLVIDAPVGTEGEYKFPIVKPEGVVLTALDPVSANPKLLRVRVHSVGAARSLFVGAYARGRMLDHRRIRVAANAAADLDLVPEDGLGGVTRVTVFEEQGGEPKPELRPVAERLVYRQPATRLKLAIKPDKARYTPGEKVSVAVSATNEKGDPAAAVVSMGVVNQSVVTMADEKTYRSMPTFVYLTSEVRTPDELEHADVLLGDHPKASTALDLLLGTQGWRRFVESVPGDQRPPASGAGANVALLKMRSALPAEVQRTSLELELGRVRAKLEPELLAATDEVSRVTTELESLRKDPSYAAAEMEKQRLVEAANVVVAGVRAKLAETIESRRYMLDRLLPGLVLAGVLLAIAGMIYGYVCGCQLRSIVVSATVIAACAALVCIWHWRPMRESGMAVATPDDQTVAVSAPMPPEAPVRADGAFVPKAEPGADWGIANGGVDWKKNAVDPEPKRLDEEKLAARGRYIREIAPGAPKGLPVEKAAEPPRPMAPVAPAFKPGGAPAGAVKADPPVGREAKGYDAGKDLYELERDRLRPKALAGADRPVDDADKKLDGRARLADDEAPRKLVEDRRRAGLERGFGPAGGGGGGFGGGRGPVPADFEGQAKLGQMGMSGRGLDRVRAVASPFVVREYAHHRQAVRGEARDDFTETLFWHPAVVVPKGGLTLGFDLADSVTSYRILAMAHTVDGRLGELASQIEVRKPVSLEPKLPVEMTSGDTLDVALTVTNDSDMDRTVAIETKLRGLVVQNGSETRTTQLAPQQRGREVFRVKSTEAEGKAELRFFGTSGESTDLHFSRLPIVPEGFPVQGAFSDALERVARHEVVLPETWVRGTLKCSLNVFPSTLSELQKGLEGLLAEPGGCFEQTSTSNYPNALVLQYLKENDRANPDLMRNARAMLDRGYAKLTAFEVPGEQRREGFEWFGQSPAHEALTAYGLMQFKDMARVTDVDPMIIDRTRAFLLSRRDGKGGFTRNQLALDTFGRAPADVTNAYIVWAVTEAGEGREVDRELDACALSAKKSADPYLRALVANALLNRGRTDEGVALLKQLAEKLSPDGALRGAVTSITGSSGQSLEIETTALALMGWLKANRPADFTAATRIAAGWIGKQRSGTGGFGATQSTILALKSLIEFTRANKQTPEAGTLSLYRGAELVGRLDFAAGTQGMLSISVPDSDSSLRPGKNEMRAEITGKNTYPYTLGWSYQTLQPPSADGCAVRLATSLDRTELDEGASARLRVTLENVSGRGQGMAVAVIGLPAGLKLPDDFKQLREMKQLRNGQPGQIASFEVRGRELVLYWRDLAPDAKIDLAIDVVAYVPGIYRGPASRAYLYYTPEFKHWVAPLVSTIKPK